MELPPGQGQRILFVDDEAALCQSALKLLQKWGYQPTINTDPEAALAQLRQRPDAFDLVITDLSMPRKSGVDLAAAIAQIRDDLPIVLASGFIGHWTASIAQQAGIREVIIKPVSPENLGRLIGRLLQPATPPARI